MLGVVGWKVWPVSNFAQQHATTSNRVYKRTQHVTSNNVGSCCSTMLRPFTRSLSLVSLMKSSTIGLGLRVWFILRKVQRLFSLGVTWNILDAIFSMKNETQTCQKQRLCRWQRACSKGTEEVVPACNSFLRSFYPPLHCYSASTQK